jgi:hypothetical protein
MHWIVKIETLTLLRPVSFCIRSEEKRRREMLSENSKSQNQSDNFC